MRSLHVRASSPVLADCYRSACHLDIESFKPGNVSLASPGHGMTASDFVRSAQHSAPALVRAGVGLGQRIRDAVAASHAAVGCNTNLGILLLIGPLVHACLGHPQLGLREALGRVLQNTTRDDAAAVFAAIRLASPGGLGRADRHDVATPVRANLLQVMCEAREYDLVARQYSNGFAEVFDIALPYLEAADARYDNPAVALSDLYLYLLRRFPDTHVRRKHGADLAEQVRAQARSAHRAFLGARSSSERLAGLQRFDSELKARAINPGTSADFCVVSCFIHRLQQQAVIHAGSSPDTSRTRRPERADVPHSISSQSIEGDMKWQ